MGCVLAACLGSLAPLGAQETEPDPNSPDPLDAPEAADPADSQPSEAVPLERALVGAWKFAKRPLDPKAAAISSINRYSEDGLYACSIRMEFPERERTVAIAGRWVVEDGDVKITITHSDAPELYKIGLVFILHDASVSGNELRYTDAAGVEQVRARVLEEQPDPSEAPESGADSSAPESPDKSASEASPSPPKPSGDEAKSPSPESGNAAE